MAADGKGEIAVLVGGGVLAAIAIAIAGRSKSTGTSVIGPDGSAVAAIQSAAVQEVQSYNQLASDRFKTAADTLVQLATAQLGVEGIAGQTQRTIISSNAATDQVRLTTAANEQIATTNTQAATKQAQIAADAATKAADTLASSNSFIAQMAEQGQIESNNISYQIALSNNAAKDVQSQNQLDATKANDSAQKTGSIFGAIGNVASAVLGALKHL